MPSSTEPSNALARRYWKIIDSKFDATEAVFNAHFDTANTRLSPEQLKAWAEYAGELGTLGLGAGPQCIFLRIWPEVVALCGDRLLEDLRITIDAIWATPNKKAIEPLISQSASIANRIRLFDDRVMRMQQWYRAIVWLAETTSISVHGKHLTHPSEALIPFINNSEQPVALLKPKALMTWLQNGVHIFEKRPDRLAEYCALSSNEGVAFLTQLRDGLSLESSTRELALVAHGLLEFEPELIPIPTHNLDEYSEHLVLPYYDELGLRLPDRYTSLNGVQPAKRYLLAAIHIYFHQQYSTRILADNLSPLQRLAVETFEDARLDYLIIKRFTGLKKYVLALHPIADENLLTRIDDKSLVRIRLSLLSRAVLDDTFAVSHAIIRSFVERVKAIVPTATTNTMRDIAIEFVARTHQQQDQRKDVIFDNTRVSYRDDNRNLWQFIESGDEEELFDPPPPKEERIDDRLKAREFPEWDFKLNQFRPQWVSLFEQLQPSGSAHVVDDILLRYQEQVRRLQRIFELIRPHERQRIRFQLDGDRMDTNLATDALVDLRSGITPGERIDESIRHDGRQIAVYVLLDLSESLNDPIGPERTMLDLTREAVSLLAWSISQLGDDFAIGGFSSDTRHRVYFQHFKGFSEALDNTVKGRIGNMSAGYSTRMGTAIRHANSMLASRTAEQKILLIITDGEPSDIDVHDEKYLIEDARHAVFEGSDKGIKPYCISVDANADNYVHHIFAARVAVIDTVEQLPKRVTEIFLKLTR